MKENEKEFAELKDSYEEIKRELESVFKTELEAKKDYWYQWHNGVEIVESTKAKEIVESIKINDELINKFEVTISKSGLSHAYNNEILTIGLELKKNGLIYRNRFDYSLTQNTRKSKLDWLFDEE